MCVVLSSGTVWICTVSHLIDAEFNASMNNFVAIEESHIGVSQSVNVYFGSAVQPLLLPDTRMQGQPLKASPKDIEPIIVHPVFIFENAAFPLYICGFP